MVKMPNVHKHTHEHTQVPVLTYVCVCVYITTHARGEREDPPSSAGKVLKSQLQAWCLTFGQGEARKGSAAGGRDGQHRAGTHPPPHCPRSSRVQQALVFHHAQRVSKRDRKEHLAASPHAPPSLPGC